MKMAVMSRPVLLFCFSDQRVAKMCVTYRGKLVSTQRRDTSLFRPPFLFISSESVPFGEVGHRRSKVNGTRVRERNTLKHFCWTFHQWVKCVYTTDGVGGGEERRRNDSSNLPSKSSHAGKTPPPPPPLPPLQPQ